MLLSSLLKLSLANIVCEVCFLSPLTKPNQTKPTRLNPQITTSELWKFVLRTLKCSIASIPTTFISLSPAGKTQFSAWKASHIHVIRWPNIFFCGVTTFESYLYDIMTQHLESLWYFFFPTSGTSRISSGILSLLSRVREKAVWNQKAVHRPETPTHLSSTEPRNILGPQGNRLTFFDTQPWGLVCVRGGVIGQQWTWKAKAKAG